MAAADVAVAICVADSVAEGPVLLAGGPKRGLDPLELANRSITSPDAREKVWQLLRELAKVIDAATPADHQLISLNITLTTAAGQQGAIETKAEQAGARVRVQDDEF